MARLLISIIIPTYNRAHLIGETLDSVLAQTYKNWECIIVDDGSIDNTTDVVSEFSDSRIQLFKRPTIKRKGASSCRNYGLEMAKGELIQFLDDDDLLDKNKLYEQVKSYSGNNELLTSKWGGFTNNSDLKSRFKYKYHSYKNFKKGINLLNTFGLYNEYFPFFVYLTPLKLIDKVGSWNEDLTNNDDAEFFTRVILKASNISFVPKALAYYRYSSTDKLSTINSVAKIKSVIKSWKLIEKEIVKNSKANKLWYVNRSKDNLYKQFQKDFPEVVQKNKLFFESRSSYNTFYYDIFKIIGTGFKF